jgi:hypothetical protein
MATDETAKPQRPIEPELEAVKQALAEREAENRSLRQTLDARTAELAVRNSAYSEQIDHQAATIVFVLGTTRDHIAPWRSVYNANLFTDTDVTTVLVSGGHNVGVVNPGPASCGTIAVPGGGRWGQWLLSVGSPDEAPPPSMGSTAVPALCDAPGEFVLVRY